MKHFLCTLTGIALLLAAESAPAQDSLAVFGHGALRVSGGLYYLSHSNSSDIYLPDFQEESWPMVDFSGVPWESDNPLLHGASFIDLDGRFEVVPGFTVHANLVAEHRGFSYGVYPRDYMVVYPKIRFAADTAVDVFGERFFLHASAGNVTGGRLYEGLDFYNIDWQGTIFSVKWKYYKVQYHKIGDLEYGVGLGLNDADDFMFLVEEFPLGAGWHADLQLGSYFHPSTGGSVFSRPETSGFGQTASLGFYPSERIRLYGQYSVRVQRDEYDLDGDFSAFLAGVSAETALGQLSLDTRAEYRHYGSRYNQDFKSRFFGNLPPYHSEHLYPISHYARPFSQWAVFTDYQDEDVDGVSVYLEALYRLPFHLVLYGMADLNSIMPGAPREGWEKQKEHFLWAFYEAGIGWSPADNILLRWTYGNKGMNIDRHFETHYMYREPVMKLTAEYGFPVVKW